MGSHRRGFPAGAHTHTGAHFGTQRQMLGKEGVAKGILRKIDRNYFCSKYLGFSGYFTTDLLKFKQHVTKPFCLVFRFSELAPEQFSGQRTLQASSPALYHKTTRATSQMFQNVFQSWLRNSQKQKIACKSKPQAKIPLLHNAGKTSVFSLKARSEGHSLEY